MAQGEASYGRSGREHCQIGPQAYRLKPSYILHICNIINNTEHAWSQEDN